MDHMRVLRRSFEITRGYPVLWLFGCILALTTARGGGGNGGGGGSSSHSFAAPAGVVGAGPLPVFDMGPGQAIALVAALIGLGLLLTAIFVVARAVAETSLIRLVDRYETTGEKTGVSQGLRLGWNRAALRIFLIDLLVALAVGLGALVLLGIACLPLLLLNANSEPLRGIGVAAAVVMFSVVIVIIIAAAILLVVLLPFAHRAVALEDQGVFSAIARGWNVLYRHAGDTIVMALALFVIGLVLAFVLIPVVLILLPIGAVAGGIPGALIGMLSSLFTHGSTPFIIGTIVAVPILLLVIGLPLLFASGLVETFTSAAWTLTYRQMITATPAVNAVPDVPNAENSL